MKFPRQIRRMYRISANMLTPYGKDALTRQAVEDLYKGATWSEIGPKSPVPVSTLFKWTKRDMSVEAQGMRQVHARRPLLLQPEERTMVVDQAVATRAAHRAVTVDWTKKAISVATDGRVPDASPGYISGFWKDEKWPSWKAQPRNVREIRPTIQDEAAAFRTRVQQYMREHQVPPSHFHTMDETGFWTGALVDRIYVNPATQDPGVVQEGDHRRDTGVVTLTADGTLDAVVIEHVAAKTKRENKQTIILERAIKGMGKDQMMQRAQGFGLRPGAANQRSVLILDGLGAHKGSQVKEILNAYNIEVFITPPQAAKFLSPCDNTFFSSMKARMARLDTSTREKKIAVFRPVCAEFPPSMILNFYRRCGWAI